MNAQPTVKVKVLATCVDCPQPATERVTIGLEDETVLVKWLCLDHATKFLVGVGA